MKYIFLTLLLLILTSSAFATDTLWQKAQSIAENSWHLVPGKTTIKMLTLPEIPANKLDKLEENEEIEVGFEVAVSHRLGEAGQIITELVSTNIIKINLADMISSENSGADETEMNEEELAVLMAEYPDGNYDENDASEDDETLGESVNKLLDSLINKDYTPKREGLFLETDKKKITIKRLNENKKIDQINCVAYDVTYSASGKRKDRQQYKIWLDSNTGVPVLGEPKIKKPFMVKRLDTFEFYSYDETKNQFTLYKETVDTYISMLGVKITMEMSTLREDYWEYPR